MPNQKSLAPDTAGTERQTLSVEEAGRILGISRGSAYAYARNGSLPTIRLGNRVLVPRQALERMLRGEPLATP
jgi:excisionase family DNA binding protein